MLKKGSLSRLTVTKYEDRMPSNMSGMIAFIAVLHGKSSVKANQARQGLFNFLSEEPSRLSCKRLTVLYRIQLNLS